MATFELAAYRRCVYFLSTTFRVTTTSNFSLVRFHNVLWSFAINTFWDNTGFLHQHFVKCVIQSSNSVQVKYFYGICLSDSMDSVFGLHHNWRSPIVLSKYNCWRFCKCYSCWAGYYAKDCNFYWIIILVSVHMLTLLLRTRWSINSYKLNFLILDITFNSIHNHLVVTKHNELAIFFYQSLNKSKYSWYFCLTRLLVNLHQIWTVGHGRYHFHQLFRRVMTDIVLNIPKSFFFNYNFLFLSYFVC